MPTNNQKKCNTNQNYKQSISTHWVPARKNLSHRGAHKSMQEAVLKSPEVRNFEVYAAFCLLVCMPKTAWIACQKIQGSRLFQTLDLFFFSLPSFLYPTSSMILPCSLVKNGLNRDCGWPRRP